MIPGLDLNPRCFRRLPSGTVRHGRLYPCKSVYRLQKRRTAKKRGVCLIASNSTFTGIGSLNIDSTGHFSYQSNL